MAASVQDTRKGLNHAVSPHASSLACDPASATNQKKEVTPLTQDDVTASNVDTHAFPPSVPPARPAPALLWSALLLAFLAAALFGYQAWDKHCQNRAARVEVLRVSARAEALIQKKHDDAENAGRELERRLSGTTPLTPAIVEAALRATSAAHPGVSALGVALTSGTINEPEAADALILRRTGDSVLVSQAPADYPAAEWFPRHLTSSAGWSAPFFRPSLQTFVLEYGSPLSGGTVIGQQPRGVVFASIVIPELDDILRRASIGSSGYAFVLGRDGSYLVHDVPDFYMGRGTAAARAQAEGDPQFSSALRRVARGDTNVIEIGAPGDARRAWVVGRPVGETGWTAVLNVHPDELMPVSNVRFRYRLMLLGVVAIVLLLIVLAALVLERWTDRRMAMWRMVGIATLVISAAIAVVLALHIDRMNTDLHGKVQILDDGMLQRYQRKVIARVAAVDRQALATIPTGLFVQSLEFNSANNVTLSGYLWQRYDDSLPKGVPRGVIFPDATSTTLTPAYSRRDASGEIDGYSFKVTLRQPFNYQRYPFDRQDIWIRLWPRSFDTAVLLTPDLASYGKTDPSSLPGLDDSLVLSGWSAQKTFFDYQDNDYDTTFGLTAVGGPGTTAELSYNILLQRSWQGPFLSNIFPLAMIAWMLFANMMNVTSKEKPWGVFAAIASLFFAIALAHSKTRDTFNAPEVLYLEYYYLIMYLMVAIVMVNSFLLTRASTLKIITYADNELPRLLFWPILMMLLLVTTIILFF
jgi:hypothetical protein